MEDARENKPIFRNLTADDPEPEITEIESMCVNCEENGVTKLLLTRIPHYKEVILMSFECEHCGFSNNEIQSGGKVQEKGVSYKVMLQTKEDLNRQVVKSDFASIVIPDLDFEIPPQSQKGEVTTIEGILTRTIQGLQQDQPLRRATDEDAADKIDKFIEKIKKIIDMQQPFTLNLTDPSGNSFIENPIAPQRDPDMEVSYFKRTVEQNHMLGIYSQQEVAMATKDEDSAEDEGNKEEELSEEEVHNRVLSFPTNCPNCSSPCETNMKVTNIPYFKEVIIMATTCEICGHRTNEVKSGGGIEPKGTRIKLRITNPSDFSRDVLKSETCSVHIPELEFDVGAGTLVGRFTTLEGLLGNIKEQLLENSPILCGDSANPHIKDRLQAFVKKFDQILANEMQVHVILDDPTGNSYLQNVYAPEPDPEMEVTYYERSFEQNEELGLNDMKTENYEAAS